MFGISPNSSLKCIADNLMSNFLSITLYIVNLCWTIMQVVLLFSIFSLYWILNLQTLHFLQNSDILASADKLAECQETITILNKQLQVLRTPATHKPQSLGSILAQEFTDAMGSGSPGASKQVQFKKEQDASWLHREGAQHKCRMLLPLKTRTRCKS
jgi:hypothetical protein